VSDVIGPDEEDFLRSTSRAFLLANRADGSPTGWPMTGIYPGDGVLEFSTYRRSQKVVDLVRDPRAAVVLAPRDSDRALVLRGKATLDEARDELPASASTAPLHLGVADGIRERAQERMKSGKRVAVRFTPTSATFVPGVGA